MWDNCLLCSGSTTGPKHHPKSGILKSPVWPSSSTMNGAWMNPLERCSVLWMKRSHALTPDSTSTPGQWHWAFQPAQLRRAARLMAPLWQQQLGSSTEHEETSVGVFAWLHVRQGTCVHLKIHFSSKHPCLAPVNASWQPAHAQGIPFVIPRPKGFSYNEGVPCCFSNDASDPDCGSQGGKASWHN